VADVKASVHIHLTPHWFRAGLLALLSGGLTFLLAAQVWYTLPERVRQGVVPGFALNLHPYQIVDTSCPTHWALRPGYDDGDVRVNRRGFRGEDVADENALWLAVGDSCTFGIGYGWVNAASRRLGAQGVNGGVEGYSIRNAICRLPDYQGTGALMTVVYIGWNDLYRDWRTPSSVGAVRLATRAWGFARERWWPRVRYWEPTDTQYVVPFMEELEYLVDRLPGDVVIVTLPGIYRTYVKPSPAVLAKGHLPAHSANAYDLAAMTAAYNDELRALSERKGLKLIDADRYFLVGEQEFIDSVHLTPKAQFRLGVWIAEELRR
jgi:lysophospholipase L1-like esterase